MKITRFLLTLTISLLVQFSYGYNPKQDSMNVIIHGFVYNDTITNPLQDVTVYIERYDSLGNLLSRDSLLTDINGLFADTVCEGRYVFWPWRAGYITMQYLDLTELRDTIVNCSFQLIRPVFESDIPDSIIISGTFEQPVDTRFTIRNTGTGTLIYSAALSFENDLKHSSTNVSEIDVIKNLPTTHTLVDNNWQLLFRDGQDQYPGNYDLKEIYTKIENGMFSVQGTFYNESVDYDHLWYEMLLNTDRDTATGDEWNGAEYMIFMSIYDYGWPIILYLDGTGWTYLGMANNCELYSNYFIIDVPLSLLGNHDLVFSESSIRPGMEDRSYFDGVPDWQFGEFNLLSMDNTHAIRLDKLYGEMSSNQEDTLTLTILPEILNEDISDCRLALKYNEPDLTDTYYYEFVSFPVIINKPLAINSFKDPFRPDLFLSNYPNPFTITTTILYSLPHDDFVCLKVFNINGQEIITLVNDHQTQGEHEIKWNADGFPGGIYFLELIVNNHVETRKLVLNTNSDLN